MEPSHLSIAVALFALAIPAIAHAAGPAERDKPATPDQAAFSLDQLEGRLGAQLAAGGSPYLPFLNTRVLRLGLYRLSAGTRDDQPVHKDDEIYYVIHGKATLRAGDELIPVQPGSTVFVKAGVEHRFLDIEEDLEVLVVFGATPHGGADGQASAPPGGGAETGAGGGDAP